MYIFCQRRKRKRTTIDSHSLMFFMFIFLLHKCKVNTESYFGHAGSARSQQSDIQLLRLRSEQFLATPIQPG